MISLIRAKISRETFLQVLNTFSRYLLYYIYISIYKHLIQIQILYRYINIYSLWNILYSFNKRLSSNNSLNQSCSNSKACTSEYVCLFVCVFICYIPCILLFICIVHSVYICIYIDVGNWLRIPHVVLSRQNLISFLWDAHSIERPIPAYRPLRLPLTPSPLYPLATLSVCIEL